MDIKQLVPEDAEAYLSIRLEALRESPHAFGSSYEEEKQTTVEKYRQRFMEPENSFTLGAFEESELVGVVALVRKQYLKQRHRATILAMYVKPEKRGTGLGKKLLLSAIEKAISLNDIEQINLSVIAQNESAKQLYQSLGFEVFGIEKNGIKVNDTYFDEEHMVMFL
ncbi:GNAT family N-acetyltransferase [Alkalibacterium sp. MB6]|uniref:GNAT family N-acetyltransferase n=1 Tax=Alkalibacterium sp. MB6 TaxID=2081965 RepID=UPI00137B7127|nr:GNAT family N-acetyltransferase [Alkalibacterium sp. MB6]